MVNEGGLFMAMIECTECGSSISDKATSCIHCGAPVETKASVKASEARVVTIQETSKSLKLQKALAVLVFIFSSVGLMAAMSVEPPVTAGKWGSVVGLSLLWYVYARIAIWWKHK